MYRSSQTLLRLAQQSSFARAASRRTPAALQLTRQQPPALWQTARFASSDNKDNKEAPPPKPEIDYEAERKLAQQKLKPAHVTVDSTTHTGWESAEVPRGTSDQQLSQGLKHDFNIIKDTVRLDEVPRESQILGLAGTIPYFGTSLATVYLAWDLTKELPTGSAIADFLFINHDTAHYLLGVLEPLQLGYGAVIISFLGAIHWGMEYAEKAPKPNRTRFRYGMGVAASIVAWPTLFLPLETGLIAQFAAFVGLYFADSRAASRGWAPYWYGTYRFLLTAMVGLAILISLVGRSELEKAKLLGTQGLTANMTSAGIADTKTDWVKLEAEEKKKLKKEKEEKEKQRKQAEEKAKKAEKAEKAAAAKDGGKKNSASKDEKKDDSDEAKSEKKKNDDKGEKKEEENSDDGKDDESKDDSKEEENKDEGNDKEDDKEDDQEDDKDAEKKSDEKETEGQEEEGEKQEGSDSAKDDKKGENSDEENKDQSDGEGDDENKSSEKKKSEEGK